MGIFEFLVYLYNFLKLLEVRVRFLDEFSVNGSF